MSQSLASILLHVIFSTKNRFPFLADPGVRAEMHAYLATVFRSYDSPTLIVGGVANHVHALCALSKNISAAELIKDAKKSSSKWIKSKGGLLTKFHWQNGYGVFSVSESQEERVRRYILNQEQHHRNFTFEDEFRTILRKHNVAFDERYVWD
jgi:putative transposase